MMENGTHLLVPLLVWRGRCNGKRFQRLPASQVLVGVSLGTGEEWRGSPHSWGISRLCSQGRCPSPAHSPFLPALSAAADSSKGVWLPPGATRPSGPVQLSGSPQPSSRGLPWLSLTCLTAAHLLIPGLKGLRLKLPQNIWSVAGGTEKPTWKEEEVWKKGRGGGRGRQAASFGCVKWNGWEATC